MGDYCFNEVNKKDMKKIIFPALTGLNAFMGLFCGFAAIIINTNVDPDIVFWLSILTICCFSIVFIFMGIQKKRNVEYAKHKVELEKERFIDMEDVDKKLQVITDDGRDPSNRILVVLLVVFGFITFFVFKVVIEYLGGHSNLVKITLISSVVLLGSFLLGYILASKFPKFIDKHNIYLLD